MSHPIAPRALHSGWIVDAFTANWIREMAGKSNHDGCQSPTAASRASWQTHIPPHVTTGNAAGK